MRICVKMFVKPRALERPTRVSLGRLSHGQGCGCELGHQTADGRLERRGGGGAARVVEEGRQQAQVEGEGLLSKVEADGYVRVDADDWVQRQLRGLRGEGDPDELAVTSEENLERSDGEAASDCVSGAERGAEGFGRHALSVEDVAVVRVVAKRVAVPSRLLPRQLEELRGEADRDAVALAEVLLGAAYCDLVVSHARDLHLEGDLGGERRGAADLFSEGRDLGPCRAQVGARRRRQRRLASHRAVAAEQVASEGDGALVVGEYHLLRRNVRRRYHETSGRAPARVRVRVREAVCRRDLCERQARAKGRARYERRSVRRGGEEGMKGRIAYMRLRFVGHVLPVAVAYGNVHSTRTLPPGSQHRQHICARH